jgi:hypothetical protein
MNRTRRKALATFSKAAVLGGVLYGLSKIPIGSAAESGIQVGTGSIPSTDGIWENGEWDDAVQVTLSSYIQQVNDKAQAFMRFKHNYDGTNLSDARLYGIGDILSDDGSQFTDQGQKYYGYLAFSFDSNNDGGLNVSGDPADYHFLIDSYDGKNYLCEALNDWNADSFTKGANKAVGASTIGTSPNSNVNHRMIEFSLPLEPILRYGPKDQNGNYVVGFNAFASDSYGNQIGILHESQLAQLIFGATPLPESGDILLPASLALTSYVASRWNKKRLSRRVFLGISVLERLTKD